MNYTSVCPHIKMSYGLSQIKNLKEKYLSILSVNARSITGKFVEKLTNLKLIRTRFSFVIIMEFWFTDESIEKNVYKYPTMNRVYQTGGGFKLFHLDFISTEVIKQISVMELV